LILDKAPSHHFPWSLEQFFFLPPNMTILLELMDQGINECTKQLYWKIMLHKHLLTDG
jgi:hypothetical protein